MINSIEELFYETFFAFEWALKDIIPDKQFLFNQLYQVFLLPESKKDELFNLSSHEEIQNIQSYKDYSLYCRCSSYCELINIRENDNEEINQLINIKGNALRKFNDLKLTDSIQPTKTWILNVVFDSASKGNIFSINLLGYLKSNGIYCKKDIYEGKKYFEKSARWNSIEGTLFALYYDEANLQKNANRLYTILSDSCYESILQKMKSIYSINKLEKIEECKLIQKGFASEKIKPSIYSKQHARIIFSTILQNKEKQRILLGKSDILYEASELPLKLQYQPLNYKNTADAFPLNRPEEEKLITMVLRNSIDRNQTYYKPICISSNSNFLLNITIKSLHSMNPDAHLEIINVSELTPNDFEQTVSNIFIRNCDERKLNIYALFFQGTIPEEIYANVCAFLKSNNRKRFQLKVPKVFLDLSAILPICFCDKQNDQYLKNICEVHSLMPINDSEKNILLNVIIQEKKKTYQLKNLSIAEEIKAKFNAYSIDKIDAILDQASRLYSHEELNLDLDLFQFLMGKEKQYIKNYGFGGTKDENDR